MTRPVFRDINIQFTAWNDHVKVGVTTGGWISFTQNGTYVLNLHFEGALQEDLEAAAAALRKVIPKSTTTVEESLWDAAS